MAQNFEIPIAFEFTFERVFWTACSFSTVERGGLFPPKQDGATRMPLLGKLHTEPAPILIRLSDTSDIVSSGSPAEVLFHAWSGELTECLEVVQSLQNMGEQIPESMSQLLISFDQQVAKQRKGDPWQLREEFMRLEETNLALLSFLQRWGRFGGEDPLYALEPPWDHTLVRLAGEKPRCVLPFLVWRFREEFRRGMLVAPETWLSNDAMLDATHRRLRFPFIGITARTCIRAIETTITLDHLRKVKSRVCARTDCDNIFSVDSNHGKIYCDQYCAHLVSVRRNRAAKKQARGRKKRKGL